MLFIDSYKGTNINDVGHQTLSDLRLLYISIVSNPIALNYQSRKIDFIFSFFFVFFYQTCTVCQFLSFCTLQQLPSLYLDGKISALKAINIDAYKLYVNFQTWVRRD